MLRIGSHAPHRIPCSADRGVTATCVGVAPYAGLKFVCYEALKTTLGRVAGLQEDQLRPWQRVGSGLLAGLLAQTVVYPLDVRNGLRIRSHTHLSRVRTTRALPQTTWPARRWMGGRDW